jgi:hypothetical protein
MGKEREPAGGSLAAPPAGVLLDNAVYYYNAQFVPKGLERAFAIQAALAAFPPPKAAP